MNPEAYVEMSLIESTHWWFKGRRAIFKVIIEELNLNNDAKILEVGCGTGGNLDLLRTFGEVSALEFDKFALEIAMVKSMGKYDIRLGSCPELIPFESKYQFDLICMFDVLEHIENDAETITKLTTLLKPNGYILITVPAYQWLYGPHDIFLHHKRRYTSKNLLNLIQKTGLYAVKITYFNFILFPLAVLVRLKEKLLKNPKKSSTKTPPKKINEFLNYIFTLERHLLKHYSFCFGLSIIAIFRKK